MGRTVIMIHGRNFKPARTPLRRLWLDAIRHGIARDYPARKLKAFDSCKKEFVYYGDVSNRFLAAHLGQRIPDKVFSRKQTLQDLKRLGTNDFTRKNYRKLPGMTSLRELAADVFGPLLSTFRVLEPVIAQVGPDMREYWNFDSQFGSDVREPMIKPLKRAMKRGDSILIIAHSLGTMIAYDTLWKFSHNSEYRELYADKKVDLFLTLGSPLSDETVKRNLKGAQAQPPRRYPSSIRRWVNVAAEDDYICHDEDVRNDYKDMIRHGLVLSIEDIAIYNLSVRDGTSNPHSSAGYLIHPKVTRVVASWLSG